MFLLIQYTRRDKPASYSNLHSNMFLLIQSDRQELQQRLRTFTFQYVSINTQYSENSGEMEDYLHSNMFLLIPAASPCILSDIQSFTFQYVSINTVNSVIAFVSVTIFTFQYVSINTGRRRGRRL